MNTRHTPSTFSIALAVVAFVLSLVPFPASTGQAAKFQAVRTEWVVQQRAVNRRTAHYACLSSIPVGSSPYSLYGARHHTRLVALAIACCAYSHAPPARYFQKFIPSSGNEDPLPFLSASLA